MSRVNLIDSYGITFTHILADGSSTPFVWGKENNWIGREFIKIEGYWYYSYIRFTKK